MRILLFVLMLMLLTACNLTTPNSTPTDEILLSTSTVEPIPSSPTLSVNPTANNITPIPPSPSVTVINVTPDATPSPVVDGDFPTTFIESYAIAARQGQQIEISYDVTINNPNDGRVYFLVRDPNGAEVTRLTIMTTESDVLIVDAQISGEYRFYATPRNLQGNYRTSYQLQNP